MAELDGMLALVAGASRPHGRACAVALCRAGARLALVDENADTAAAVGARLEGEVAAYGAESSPELVAEALASVVERQGVPDILVTCAAPPHVAPSTGVDPHAVSSALNANALHAFLWCQAVGHYMIEAGRGAIINVTGLSGLGGWPGWAPQGMALAAVHNLTHTLATEWTRFGVRVNCLVPGITEGDLADLLKTPEAPDRETVLRRIPVGRLANDDDLGKALIYLTRPEASFISGEILRVDGAWDVWGRYYAVDPHGAKR
jgi:NAD(P)-dependent dehydrogenase (short-subunit alcohol dehydrogenase family)